MQKLVKLAIPIVLVPLIFIVFLYILTLKLQPEVIDLNSENTSSTLYMDPDKVYRVAGDFEVFKDVLYSPEQLKDHINEYDAKVNISDLNKDLKLSEKGVCTIHTHISLAKSFDYGCISSGLFAESKVYVNGCLVYCSQTFGSDSPVYPSERFFKIPASPSGEYDVVVNVITPSKMLLRKGSCIKIGSAEHMDKISNSCKLCSFLMVAVILFTVIFCLLQNAVVKQERAFLTFVLFALAELLYALMSDGTVLTYIFPKLHYQLGYILNALKVPVLMITLLFHTLSRFPKQFNRRIGMGCVCLQLIPFVSDLLFNDFVFLTGISHFVLLLPLIFCVSVFVRALYDDEPYSLEYGIGLTLIFSGIFLSIITESLAIPARYTYVYGFLVYTIVDISVIGKRYSDQDAKEKLLKEELTNTLEEMQSSENAFLNAQMKPHFLYNTLNTIADLCATDPEKAKKLITTLSEYLKMILALDNMEVTVPLKRELEIVDSYISIEKERFPNINFYHDYPIHMPRIEMPPMSLQPLIENAIKHGVRKSDRPGVITLRIRDSYDSVTFYVSDNGAGMDEETISKMFALPKENKSIGIYNIDKRLKNRYNKGLHIESTLGLGTCVSFVIYKGK